MLAVVDRRRIQYSQEEITPDKQRGAAAEDGESGGAGNARGTSSGRPNGFRHGCQQEEHTGEGVKRVGKREVCAKRHLTFAFFSPRVCPGWRGPATEEGWERMARGKMDAASHGG